MKPLRCAENRAEYRRARRIGLLAGAGVCALVLLFVFCVWFTAVRVEDDGMSPTLHAGDAVLFDRLSKYVAAPARGDMIACRGEGGLWLGRIVALPGETVAAQNGRLFINGVLLNESLYTSEPAPDIDEYTLPDGCYFVLPDARSDMQLDLAAMTVAALDIYGRASIRIAPAYRIGLFAE